MKFMSDSFCGDALSCDGIMYFSTGNVDTLVFRIEGIKNLLTSVLL